LDLQEDESCALYATMLKIRRFEETIVELITQRGRRIGAHLYIGEEAVATGVCAALREDDFITSTHRGHGHCIAKGTPLTHMMAELYGKRNGTNKGKGGSMHIAEPAIGILGANGIVGASIPIAVGAGLSIKLRGTDQVGVSFFGDGASNQGTFHEGLNLAAIWKLPVVFVCENNQYAIGVPVSYSVPIPRIAARAGSYGFPGVTVDGMDVLAVYKAARDAVARARQGLGPTLLECTTYRFMGHSGPYAIEPFGQPYRTRDEIARWRTRDPLRRLKQQLRDDGVPESRFEAIHAEVEALMDDAVEFAEASPEPLPAEALDDLWAEEVSKR
jgi:TPP-dependent pyruvate/acetoin dehydrogenase alpha subunit